MLLEKTPEKPGGWRSVSSGHGYKNHLAQLCFLRKQRFKAGQTGPWLVPENLALSRLQAGVNSLRGSYGLDSANNVV
jgi:hypothetical protein